MFDTRKYLAVSVAMSLLLHFLLFFAAKKLPAFEDVKPKEAKLSPRKPIKLSTFKFKKRPEKKTVPKFNINLKESPTKLAEILNKNNPGEIKDHNIELKKGKPTKKIDSILGNAPNFKLATPSKELPPNIYHLDVANSNLKLPDTGSKGLQNRLPEMQLKSPSKGNPLASGLKGGPSSSNSSTSPQISFRRSLPSITPPDLKFRGGRANNPGRSIGSPGFTDSSKKSDKDETKELESFLNIRPFIYIDRSDDTGYFRLDLTLNAKARGLEPQPKDVFFIVDTSKSISSDQLQEFKDGISAGIKSLAPNDRFEIVDFDTKSQTLFNSFKTPNAESLGKAQDFIDGFSSGGLTDVFGSLRPFVDTTRKYDRPLMLYLLTDGVSTVKESMQNSPLIKEITSVNKGMISIFGFSCGDNINSFLIDFLTYRNRGDSLIINGTDGAGPQLGQYINNRSEIIVSDLNYRYMGENKKDVFPKILPHMYRKRTLSLFGTFKLDEKETMVQMTGNSSSGKRQLIYRFRYNEAERANRELAKSWAAQKIFHLIGKLTERPDAKTVMEIRQLQQKFEVYIQKLWK